MSSSQGLGLVFLSVFDVSKLLLIEPEYKFFQRLFDAVKTMRHQ
jgi:hypothetical protein